MFYTSSHSALHLCEVSCKYLAGISALLSGHKYMVEIAMFSVQRAVTPKVGIPDLRFICSAHRLIVLYICIKFGENITDGIKVMERTRMMEALTDGHSKFRTV